MNVFHELVKNTASTCTKESILTDALLGQETQKSKLIYMSEFDYAGYTLQFQFRSFFCLTCYSFNAFFAG